MRGVQPMTFTVRYFGETSITEVDGPSYEEAAVLAARSRFEEVLKDVRRVTGRDGSPGWFAGTCTDRLHYMVMYPKRQEDTCP